MKVKSLERAQYFALFIDDSLRYSEVTTVKTKIDIFAALKITKLFCYYKERVEKETGRSIKQLKMYNLRITRLKSSDIF